MHENVLSNELRLGRGREARGDPTVQIPVREPDGDWVECFPEAATASDLTARVQRLPGRLVLHVTFPADSDREAVMHALDATVELIAQAKDLDSARKDRPELAGVWVRDWASRQGRQ